MILHPLSARRVEQKKVFKVLPASQTLGAPGGGVSRPQTPLQREWGVEWDPLGPGTFSTFHPVLEAGVQ